MIDNQTVEKALGFQPAHTIECDELGLVSSPVPSRILTFVDDPRFIRDVMRNPHVTAVFVTDKLAEAFCGSTISVILCDDPRFCFYSLLNFVGAERYTKHASIIDPSASIHPRASVSEYNVRIGSNSVIEANATILSDVVVGNDCTIQAGAALGVDGFEFKRTSRGILHVFHSGNVILDNDVVVGANSTIAKGLFVHRDTVIGPHTKLDSLVNICHGAQVGAECFVAASATICGSATIGNRVWIGPGCSVSSAVKIGDNASITLGSVVMQDVPEGARVTGNFAIPHDSFMRRCMRWALQDRAKSGP